MAISEDWAVVGGGMLGLELARRLQAEGRSVTVLEAAPHLGGLAATWELDGLTWDKHYHVILLSDFHTRGLLKQLDLEGDFRAVETRTGFFTDGKLYSMSNSFEFLKFPPLGLLSKVRLGATIFHASRVKNWRKLEAIPVVDWLTKWSGKRTTQKIWLPLLRAKLGESWKDASAAFLWATIARMYAARRSGLKTEMFGYVRGGYARILASFAERLRHDGVTIETGVRVTSIVHEQGRVKVATTTGDQTFDKVVFTGPTIAAAKLIPHLSDGKKARLNAIRYQGIVCASVLLKQKLADFYVTNITDPAPFTAVIEMSALVDREEFRGRHLVYLPKYVAADDPIFDETDETIRGRFVAKLTEMYPHFQPSDVLAFQVSRVRQVFPIPTLNYSQGVPGITTTVPGVYLVNSAQIVNGTLNVNETLKLAAEAMPTLLGDAARRTQALQEAAR